jgi:hypothetical protein
VASGLRACGHAARKSTFPHKYDTHPERGITGRDAYENAIERCAAKARAADR